MGIGPYITASIIMQLLTVAIPRLEQIQKDGEEGRKKISQYTRIMSVVLAFLQGAGQVYTIHSAFKTLTGMLYCSSVYNGFRYYLYYVVRRKSLTENRYW